MLNDSDRLLRTVEQVLRAGAVAKGSARRSVQLLSVTELVGECVATARRQHALDGEALQQIVDLPSRAPVTVRGDRDELQAAISNLIDNAVKYSGAQVRVQVMVTAQAPGSVLVRVRDHGVGIPERELKRIFHRFTGYSLP